jgi:hypothetical protein
MGGSPHYGVKVAMGKSGPAIAVEMACRRITTNTMKIFEGLSKSKNIGFNLKKLLIVAGDLTL